MRVTSADADRMWDLFQAVADDVLAYLERRVDPREDAADLLSDTMMTAWKNMHRVPLDEEDARMWLFGIAKNALLNHRRGRRRRLAATDRLRSEIATTASHSETERVDAAHDVRSALAELPDDLSELVRLIHWDQFTLVEASALLGIPAGTARSRYFRARALLAKALLPTESAPSTEQIPATGVRHSLSS
jgi:RNA polymerase sigma-70 factor (ECF subfamily)